MAKIKCQLDEKVASGDKVTCTVTSGYAEDHNGKCHGCADGSVCKGAKKSDTCTISASKKSCTVQKLDCGCSPFKVKVTAKNGSLGRSPTYSSGCSYGTDAYYTGNFHIVYLKNPSTCTINLDYNPVNPVDPCTYSAPGAPTNLYPNGQSFPPGLISASWSTNARNCSGCPNCTDNFYAQVWKSGGGVFQSMGSTTGNSWTINADQGEGTYYWHVRQENGYLASAWSQGSFVVTSPRTWTIKTQARCGNGTGVIADHVTRMWGINSDLAWSDWVDNPKIGTHIMSLTLIYDTSYYWIGMDDGTDPGNLDLSDANPPSGITKALFGETPVYRWKKTDLPNGNTYSLDFKAPSSWCNSPPNTPTLVAPPHNVWINYNPTFKAYVSDPNGSSQQVLAYFSYGGWGSWVSGAGGTSSWGPVSVADTNGTWWKAYAHDSLGTTSGWSGSWLLKKDTVAPSISLYVNPTGWTNGNPTWSWSASDSGGSGLRSSNRYYYYLDGVAQGYTNSTSYTPSLGNGSHKVYVYAYDNAGNWSGSGWVYAYVDKTAPSGTFSPNSQSWTKNNVSTVFNPSDTGGSGVYRWRYRTSSNGGSTYGGWSGYINGDTNSTITLSSTGNWKINSVVTDNANNSGSIYSGLYQIDKVAPAINNFNVQMQGVSSVTVSWIVTDVGGSHLNRVKIWRANYNSTNCSDTNKTGCVWGQVGSPYFAPANSDSWSSSAVNTSLTGSYWYGLHVLDNATNQTNESSPIKITMNNPPIANFTCLPGSCAIYTGEILTLQDNSTDINNNIIRSEWDILNWGSAPDTYCNSSGCGSPAGSCDCNYTLQSAIVGRGTYNVSLKVKDSFNETNTYTRSVTVKQEIIVNFKCSLDNANWQDCAGFETTVGEQVYLLDQSIASEGATISSRSWTFQDADPATANTVNPQTKFSEDGLKQVSLMVKDSAGRSKTLLKDINVQQSVPEWEEIIPITWQPIREKLASLIAFYL